MTQKVFISYSHADEGYKLQLINHLSVLQREGLIDTWHDRKIIAGQDWGKEIDDNLVSSTIILLLISSDFLGSEYCFDIEMKKAMELHESKKAVVVPVIIRSCDWARTPFSKIQALPKESLPIKKWDDEDDAWLNVAEGIRNTIDHLTPSHNSLVEIEKSSKLTITPEFITWLEDTDISLSHRRTSKVLLSDIYVLPDIKSLSDFEKNSVKIKSIINIISKPSKYMVFGESQQGKTSFLKYTFKECYKKGLVPIYFRGVNINNSDLEKNINREVKLQYEGDITLTKDNVVILLDDLCSIKINDKAREKLLKSINENYKHIIITSNESLSYVIPEIQELDNYLLVNMLKFGHQKRAEITEKWVSLGIEDQISDEDLYTKSDDLKSRLDSIIRGNIVPPKPIYVLMLLQMFEAYSKQDLELTSHGHCYQELIYQAFKQASIRQDEVNKYLNILTELSWVQHKNGDGLSPDEIDCFFNDYEKIFLKVDRKDVIKKLQINSILRIKDEKLSFKYPYIFYFFVAKKIAEGYTKNINIKNEVNTLLNELHREDYANILVFVTHHTKDSWILDEIQITLMELFENEEKADLSKDKLSFMDDFINQIPQLVMERRKISEERKNHNERLDYIDDKVSDDEKKYKDNTYDSGDLLAKINKIFKGIEIAGQIIRNRHASLSRESLYSLVEEGSNTGLRFLNFFISLSDIAKTEVVRAIEIHLYQHPNLTNNEVHKIAESAFLQLTYGVINAVIIKISSAIGSKEAQEIYEEFEKREGTPAVILLNKAISMHYHKKLDVDDINRAGKILSNNAVCSRILRELVIHHTYMFPVNYRDKQRLSESLDITVHSQRLADKCLETKI